MIRGIVICFVVILILNFLTPFWWWIMVVPCIYGIVRAHSGKKAFFVGMTSAGLVWLLGSLYYILTSAGIIAQRVATMMNIGSPYVLIVATTVIAMLASGCAGTSGYVVKKALRT